jgi:hypothetical protein
MPKTVAIDVGSGKTIAFSVSDFIFSYFGLNETALDQTPKLKRRKQHTRQLYDKETGLPRDGVTANVPTSEWYDVPAAQADIIGKNIQVPTEIPRRPGSTEMRMKTIRVPNKASNYAIAVWIKKGFDAAKRPTYFLTPSGKRYPVNVTDPPGGDVNPGNTSGDTGGDAGGGTGGGGTGT